MTDRNKIFIPWGKLFLIFSTVIILAILTGIIVTRITINSQKKVIIPDLAGKNVVDALEEINRKELNLEIAERSFDSSVPVDYIISHEPQAGEEVKAGRIIRIIVSRGTKHTTVPNVENTLLREAQGFLRRNGWEIRRISFIPSPYVEEGKIIAQTPLPDSEIFIENNINLLVSSGARINVFYMPDLIGKDINEVKNLLRELELAVGEVTEEENNDWEKEIVLEQNPSAGYMVSVGDTVGLTVNTRIRKEEEIKGRMVVITYTSPAGLVGRQVKIIVSDEKGSSEVFNQTVSPGEKVKIAVTVSGEARAKIFLDEEFMEEKEL